MRCVFDGTKEPCNGSVRARVCVRGMCLEHHGIHAGVPGLPSFCLASPQNLFLRAQEKNQELLKRLLFLVVKLRFGHGQREDHGFFVSYQHMAWRAFG